MSVTDMFKELIPFVGAEDSPEIRKEMASIIIRFTPSLTRDDVEKAIDGILANIAPEEVTVSEAKTYIVPGSKRKKYLLN